MLVNGSAAVRDVDAVYGDRLHWEEVDYESVNGRDRQGRPKRLWHKQGIYAASHGAVPLVGFPFLKKPATHNSSAEVEQLGRKIRAFLETV